MFAQVVQGGTTREDRLRLDALVKDVLMPALDLEPGFAGAYNLVDRDSGDAIMVMLWSTREQAELPPKSRGSAFRDALARIAALSSRPPRSITVWEVHAQV